MQNNMTSEEIELLKCYDKIRKSIKSSTNKMHIDVCSTMIGYFVVRFSSLKEVDYYENNLLNSMNEQMQKLHLIII